EVFQDTAHPVEGTGDHVRPAGHAALERLGLPRQPHVTFSVPGVVLAVLAVVARMTPKPSPQVRDVARGVGRGMFPVSRAHRAPPGAGSRGTAGEPVAHGGREVLAVLRRARAERPGNPDLVDHLGGHREVRHRQPLDLTSLREDQRTGPGELGQAAVTPGPGETGMVLAAAVMAAGATARAIGRAAVAVAAPGGMQAGLEDHREAGPA